MSYTAFVTGPAALARPSPSMTASSFTSARPTSSFAKRASSAAVRMVVETPPPKESAKDTIVDPDDKGEAVPQGFTLFSELWYVSLRPLLMTKDEKDNAVRLY